VAVIVLLFRHRGRLHEPATRQLFGFLYHKYK
jgi:hypothetical protein